MRQILRAREHQVPTPRMGKVASTLIILLLLIIIIIYIFLGHGVFCRCWKLVMMATWNPPSMSGHTNSRMRKWACEESGIMNGLTNSWPGPMSGLNLVQCSPGTMSWNTHVLKILHIQIIMSLTPLDYSSFQIYHLPRAPWFCLDFAFSGLGDGWIFSPSSMSPFTFMMPDFFIPSVLVSKRKKKKSACFQKEKRKKKMPKLNVPSL